MAKRKQMVNPVDLIASINPFSTAAEQYRKIRTNIEFSSADKKIKSLVVTSSGPSEGKSTTAANLAIVFANTGSRVLLVDADLRRPSVALSFKVPNVNGLSNYLTEGNSSSGSFRKESTYLTQGSTALDNRLIETSTENLYIMPSGPMPPNPSELLRSKKMQELVDVLEESFDLVMCEKPMAINYEEAKKMLDMVQAKIIGVIYNGKKQGDDSYYYYGAEGTK